MTLVLGMDIGGTQARARLATADGTIVAEAEAASASLTAAGRARAGRALDELLAALGLHGPADASGLRETWDAACPPGHQSLETLDAICVGTAGSGSPASVEWFEHRLASLTTTKTIIVVNDSRLALPAAGLDEGIAVVSGTGSTAVGVVSGREERAGGWGYLLGDEGSGYWIAREGIRRILDRHDAHDDPGPLGAALLDDSVTGAADPFAAPPAVPRTTEPGRLGAAGATRPRLRRFRLRGDRRRRRRGSGSTSGGGRPAPPRGGLGRRARRRAADESRRACRTDQDGDRVERPRGSRVCRRRTTGGRSGSHGAVSALLSGQGSSGGARPLLSGDGTHSGARALLSGRRSHNPAGAVMRATGRASRSAHASCHRP